MVNPGAALFLPCINAEFRSFFMSSKWGMKKDDVGSYCSQQDAHSPNPGPREQNQQSVPFLLVPLNLRISVPHGLMYKT